MAIQPDQSFYDAALAILGGLGIQPTNINVNLLVAWEWCEKPHYAGAAWQYNNPLNTTEPATGAYSINSDGVKDYPDQQTGVMAIAKTIINGDYPSLLAGLQQSNANLFFSAPGELSTWGTGWNCPYQDYYLLPAYTPPGSSAPGGVPTGTVVAIGAFIASLAAIALALIGVEKIEGVPLD